MRGAAVVRADAVVLPTMIPAPMRIDDASHRPHDDETRRPRTPMVMMERLEDALRSGQVEPRSNGTYRLKTMSTHIKHTKRKSENHSHATEEWSKRIKHEVVQPEYEDISDVEDAVDNDIKKVTPANEVADNEAEVCVKKEEGDNKEVLLVHEDSNERVKGIVKEDEKLSKPKVLGYEVFEQVLENPVKETDFNIQSFPTHRVSLKQDVCSHQDDVREDGVASEHVTFEPVEENFSKEEEGGAVIRMRRTSAPEFLVHSQPRSKSERSASLPSFDNMQSTKMTLARRNLTWSVVQTSSAETLVEESTPSVETFVEAQVTAVLVHKDATWQDEQLRDGSDRLEMVIDSVTVKHVAADEEAVKGLTMVPRKRGRPPKSANKLPVSVQFANHAKKINRRHSRRSFRHENIQTFKPCAVSPPWRFKSNMHRPRPAPHVPAVAASIHLADRTPSPDALTIDLRPSDELDTVAFEATPTRKSSTSSLDDGQGRRQSVVSVGEMSDSSHNSHDSHVRDEEDIAKKKRKRDTASLLKDLNEHHTSSMMKEKRQRLSQDLPKFNWLEEKYSNPSRTATSPPVPRTSPSHQRTPSAQQRTEPKTMPSHATPTQLNTTPTHMSPLPKTLPTQSNPLTQMTRPPEMISPVSVDNHMTASCEQRPDADSTEARRRHEDVVRSKEAEAHRLQNGNHVSPATWGFSPHLVTMARHVGTCFDTGEGASRAYRPQHLGPDRFQHLGPRPQHFAPGPIGVKPQHMGSEPLRDGCLPPETLGARPQPTEGGPLRDLPKHMGSSPLAERSKHTGPNTLEERHAFSRMPTEVTRPAVHAVLPSCTSQERRPNHARENHVLEEPRPYFTNQNRVREEQRLNPTSQEQKPIKSSESRAIEERRPNSNNQERRLMIAKENHVSEERRQNSTIQERLQNSASENRPSEDEGANRLHGVMARPAVPSATAAATAVHSFPPSQGNQPRNMLGASQEYQQREKLDPSQAHHPRDKLGTSETYRSRESNDRSMVRRRAINPSHPLMQVPSQSLPAPQILNSMVQKVHNPLQDDTMARTKLHNHHSLIRDKIIQNMHHPAPENPVLNSHLQIQQTSLSNRQQQTQENTSQNQQQMQKQQLQNQHTQVQDNTIQNLHPQINQPLQNHQQQIRNFITQNQRPQVHENTLQNPNQKVQNPLQNQHSQLQEHLLQNRNSQLLESAQQIHRPQTKDNPLQNWHTQLQANQLHNRLMRENPLQNQNPQPWESQATNYSQQIRGNPMPNNAQVAQTNTANPSLQPNNNSTTHRTHMQSTNMAALQSLPPGVSVYTSESQQRSWAENATLRAYLTNKQVTPPQDHNLFGRLPSQLSISPSKRSPMETARTSWGPTDGSWPAGEQRIVQQMNPTWGGGSIMTHHPEQERFNAMEQHMRARMIADEMQARDIHLKRKQFFEHKQYEMQKREEQNRREVIKFQEQQRKLQEEHRRQQEESKLQEERKQREELRRQHEEKKQQELRRQQEQQKLEAWKRHQEQLRQMEMFQNQSEALTIIHLNNERKRRQYQENEARCAVPELMTNSRQPSPCSASSPVLPAQVIIEKIPLSSQRIQNPISPHTLTSPLASQTLKSPLFSQPLKDFSKTSQPIKDSMSSPSHKINLPIQPLKSPLSSHQFSQSSRSPMSSQSIKSPLTVQPFNSPMSSQPLKSPLSLKPLTSPEPTQPLKSPVLAQTHNNPVSSQPLMSPVYSPVKNPLQAHNPLKSPSLSRIIHSPVPFRSLKSPLSSQPLKSPFASLPLSSSLLSPAHQPLPLSAACIVDDLPMDLSLPKKKPEQRSLVTSPQLNRTNLLQSEVKQITSSDKHINEEKSTSVEDKPTVVELSAPECDYTDETDLVIVCDDIALNNDMCDDIEQTICSDSNHKEELLTRTITPESNDIDASVLSICDDLKQSITPVPDDLVPCVNQVNNDEDHKTAPCQSELVEVIQNTVEDEKMEFVSEMFEKEKFRQISDSEPEEVVPTVDQVKDRSVPSSASVIISPREVNNSCYSIEVLDPILQNRFPHLEARHKLPVQSVPSATCESRRVNYVPVIEHGSSHVSPSQRRACPPPGSKLCSCGMLAQFTCSNCKSALYCGPACQRNAWAVHGKECQQTRRGPTQTF